MSTNFSQSSRTIHESDFLSIRDIFTVLFKHRREILAIFAFLTVLSLVVPIMMTPIYQAESSLMVKIGREHMYGTEVGDQAPKVAFDLQALIDPEIEILTSRDLREMVLNTIGVQAMYPKILVDDSSAISPRDVALKQFQGNLTATQSGESNVIKITFQHNDPQIAARAVNLLTEFWKEKHLAIFSNPQTSFLEEQVEVFHEALEQSESQLQGIKREHGISSLLEQRGLYLKQRQDLDSILKSTENQVEGLATKMNSLKRHMKRIPQNIPVLTVNQQKHLMIDNAIGELLKLQRKERQLLGKYRESNPLVTEIREEIALIRVFIEKQEAQLKDHVTRERNPVFQELTLQFIKTGSELGALKTKAGVTLAQIEKLDRKIVQLNELEKQFDSLQREVDKDKENLKMYMRKAEMAHISAEMDKRQMANVSVIQAAPVPIEPIKPRRLPILCVGMALGLLGGIAWAFVAEFFQGGYTRPEQASLEQGIPVLASISYKS